MITHQLKNIQLQYARWDDLPDEIRAVFIAMMGGDAQLGSDFYQLYFYWFNIAHETGHILRRLYGTATANAWIEEQQVNQFAVSYWRAKGETERLLRLETYLHRALKYLPDPVPAYEERTRYLNEHLQEISNNPRAYAHYQFNLVLDALARPLELAHILRSMVSVQANDGTTIPLQPDFPLDEELPHRAIHDLRKTLAVYGLNLPDIQIICFYSPALQFVTWENE